MKPATKTTQKAQKDKTPQRPALQIAAPAVTVVEGLASTLRARILNGDFAPGEFLRDLRMVEEYSVSRNTFRAAAQTLVAQGILRQIANRGFFVPSFGPDDVVDITRLRGVLEGEAVRMIVLSGAIPQDALQALEIMKEASRGDAANTLVAADKNFHRAIVAASASERLQRSYDVLEGEIELLLVQRQSFYEDPKEMYEEHKVLIESLRSRDFETARDAFVEHWDDLRIKLLRQAGTIKPGAKAGHGRQN